MQTDGPHTAPPPPLASETSPAAPPPLPAEAPPAAVAENSPVSQGVIGGLATGLLAWPVAYPAFFLAGWFFSSALSVVSGHRIRTHSGSYDWLASSVGGFLVGAIAAGIAGGLLVHFLFRKADPKTYFRVGALAMLPVAIFWGIRGGTGFSAVVWIGFIWLGSLLGLHVTSLYTDAGRSSPEGKEIHG